MIQRERVERVKEDREMLTSRRDQTRLLMTTGSLSGLFPGPPGDGAAERPGPFLPAEAPVPVPHPRGA